jgi:hypothetical protein
MVVALLALLLGVSQQPEDTVGPIWLGEPLQQIVAAFGPGTRISCKEEHSVSGSCDVLVEYSDGSDLLFLDLAGDYGLSAVRITEAAGADGRIARLPSSAGKLDAWRYQGYRVFDEQAWKAALATHDEAQRESKTFIGHYPASIGRNETGQLQFDLFEE